MRSTVLALLLLVSAVPAAAQPYTAPPAGTRALDAALPALPSGAGEGRPVHVLRAFGGGVVGACVLGGLGLVVGSVDLNDFSNDPERYESDGVEVPLAPLGVMLGSALGVLAVENGRREGLEVGLTLVGSVLGGLMTSIAAAAFTEGDLTGAAVGFVGGSAAGSVLGLVVARGGRGGDAPVLYTFDAGTTRVGLVGFARGAGPGRRAAVSLVRVAF